MFAAWQSPFCVFTLKRRRFGGVPLDDRDSLCMGRAAVCRPPFSARANSRAFRAREMSFGRLGAAARYSCRSLLSMRWGGNLRLRVSGAAGDQSKIKKHKGLYQGASSSQHMVIYTTKRWIWTEWNKQATKNKCPPKREPSSARHRHVQ